MVTLGHENSNFSEYSFTSYLFVTLRSLQILDLELSGQYEENEYL